jgi:acetylornithine deacetylase/succinyl-diaminopimelate desuccinylase-like protein
VQFGADMDQKNIQKFVKNQWNDSILPILCEYISIPNKSPAFDHDWQQHGYMEQAIQLIAKWCEQQNLAGATIEIVRLENRTPVLFIEIPGDNPNPILLYGHLDKQPEMVGWREGLHPWQSVKEGDRLYGRGGADDGYAVFAAVTAIKALQQQNIPHNRCVILIEACEESGSYDLPAYIDWLSPRIGTPYLVICLDSGCGNYEQLWNTTSLRGLVSGKLTIELLKEGVHSGNVGGIFVSAFTILRQLLNRIENENTGTILLPELNSFIPPNRIEEAKMAALVLGNDVYHSFPLLDGVQPQTLNNEELVLNRTWRPALAITGINGLPCIENAGNVFLPKLSIKLSMRLPPSCDANQASQALQQVLVANPPSGAKISYEPDLPTNGWNAPKSVDWLSKAINQASNRYFGKAPISMGEGGSIPFMGMLGEKFPYAQFLITGVLGPESNAHGPNEFLHLPTAQKLTCCVADVIASGYEKS